jgi:hypothetical protein
MNLGEPSRGSSRCERVVGICYGSRNSSSGVEDSVGLRDYLFYMGVRISRDSRWRPRSSAVPSRAYAYVNPVVAVVLGYFLAGERLDMRTILGTLSVLISVIVITTTRVKRPVPTLAAEETG